MAPTFCPPSDPSPFARLWLALGLVGLLATTTSCIALKSLLISDIIALDGAQRRTDPEAGVAQAR